MVAVAHPEAALLDPELHAAALADAERRLGRALTAGEQRIDLVRLDRDLAAGKTRLVAAIETERRSAASRFARDALAGRSPRMRLRLSPNIRRALRGLYDAGRAAGRAELARAGFNPDRLPKAFAAVPVRLAVIEERIGSRLDVLGTEYEHRLAVAVDLSTASRTAILDAVQRLPGVRAIAADFTSVPAFAGLGSVWDEADAAGVTSAWTYSAVMDDGTCETCAGYDGETYESWDAIQEVLPDGGPNPDCDGGDRCRCRAVPEFGDQAETTAGPGPLDAGPGPSPILDALPEASRPLPAFDTISVNAGAPVPPDLVRKANEMGLNRPLENLTATTPFGRDLIERLGAQTSEGAYKTATGEWTPEREALHDRIVSSHFDGKVAGDTREAFFTSGGGASGKSAALFERADGTTITPKQLAEMERAGEAPTDLVMIDPDRIKELLPEYHAMRDAGDMYAASFVHEESSMLAAEIVAQARARGLSYLLDTTGSGSTYLSKIQAAVDAGYDAKVTMYSIDTNDAIVRSMARGDKKGRYVSLQALRAAHAGASRNITAWMDSPLLKEWRIYDNTERPPTLVARGGGGAVEIFDRPRWDAILAKASETTNRP